MTTETTSEITTEERAAFLRSLRYVDELFGAERVPCDGVRWHEVPLRALYPWGPKQSREPTGTDRFRCRFRSRWLFRALAPRKKDDHWDTAESGSYCTHHLLAQISNSERETERAGRHWRKWREHREQVRREVLGAQA